MADVEPTAAIPLPRWRVVLVRLPLSGAEALASVLPRERAISAEDLPLVLRVVPDLETALQTVHRLEFTGAVATVMEELGSPDQSPFCSDHPTGLASQRCQRCTRAICSGCAALAKGASLCPTCWRRQERGRQRVRLRQLLMMLGFAIFLAGVSRWMRDDAEKVPPQGPVSVGIFQFAPPNTHLGGIVGTLNGWREAGPSFLDLPAWYQAEHRRYTGMDGPFLNLTIRGPWPMQVRPPALPTPDDPWWKSLLQGWRYVRYFKQITKDQGINPDRFGVRIYVVYGHGASDMASHSRGSEKGRVAISYIDLDEKNPAYAVLTVAHELAHTLGAIDLYDEQTSLSRYPEGYVEPRAQPLYPQRYAELMAVDIPMAMDAEAEVRSLDQVRIGYRTAALIHWIGEEQADLYYQPDAFSAAEALLPAEQRPAEEALPSMAPPPDAAPPP